MDSQTTRSQSSSPPSNDNGTSFATPQPGISCTSFTAPQPDISCTTFAPPTYDNNYTQRTVNKLRDEASRMKVLIDRAKQDVIAKEKLTKEVAEIKNAKSILEKTISRYTQLTKDSEEYRSFRYNELMRDITMSIYKTRSIIKECEDMIPKFSDGEFWLETASGGRVSKREGEGAKSLIDLFMRHMLLINTDYIPVLILDERMAEVNAEYSMEASKYLNILSREMLIISIEQKPEVYANVTDLISYRVEKIDGVSNLICETPEVLDRKLREANPVDSENHLTPGSASLGEETGQTTPLEVQELTGKTAPLEDQEQTTPNSTFSNLTDTTFSYTEEDEFAIF